MNLVALVFDAKPVKPAKRPSAKKPRVPQRDGLEQQVVREEERQEIQALISENERLHRLQMKLKEAAQ